jgi:hypothetical protein
MQNGLPIDESEQQKLYDLIYGKQVPENYSNVFYVSGTAGDVKIHFGQLRPKTILSTDLEISHFSSAVSMTHEVALQLAQSLLNLLGGEAK